MSNNTHNNVCMSVNSTLNKVRRLGTDGRFSQPMVPFGMAPYHTEPAVNR